MWEANDREGYPKNEVSDDKGADEPMVIKTGDTQVRVGFNEETGVSEFRLGGKSKYKKSTRWSNDPVHFLFNLQDVLSERLRVEHELEIFRAHKRGDELSRGHPNFRGKGLWRDWAWVIYGNDGKFCYHIWCFVVIPRVPGNRISYGRTWLEEGTFAVVETSKNGKLLPGERTSELIMPINKDAHLNIDGHVTENIFSLANMTVFITPACVVADIGGPPNIYYMVEPQDNWVHVFIE